MGSDSYPSFEGVMGLTHAQAAECDAERELAVKTGNLLPELILLSGGRVLPKLVLRSSGRGR